MPTRPLRSIAIIGGGVAGLSAAHELAERGFAVTVYEDIISNWDVPGGFIDKPARECSRDEVRAEVWAQLKAHLTTRGTPPFRDDALVDWYLADSIEHRPDGTVVNQEPLLINTAGSWKYRPEAVTRITNFFLAGDYVRTNTDIATMESANEAARRAVNGVLDAAGLSDPRCTIWDLDEPAAFKPLQAVTGCDSSEANRTCSTPQGEPHEPVRTRLRRRRHWRRTWRTAGSRIHRPTGRRSPGARATALPRRSFHHGRPGWLCDDDGRTAHGAAWRRRAARTRST
jgi:hypothetical protein